MNWIFCERVNCLMAYSFFSASDFVFKLSEYTKVTGKRVRVYLDAVPALWAESRFARSVVYPVYNVWSAHLRM